MTVFKQVSSPSLLLVSQTGSPAPKHKRLVEPMLLCNVLIVPHFNFKSNKTETSVKSPEIRKSKKVSSLYFWLVFEHFLPFLIVFLPPHCFKLTSVLSNKALFWGDNPQIKQRGWWVRQAGLVENLRLCPNPLSCERSDPWLWRGFIQTMCRAAVSSELHAVHFPLWGSVAYKSGY